VCINMFSVLQNDYSIDVLVCINMFSSKYLIVQKTYCRIVQKNLLQLPTLDDDSSSSPFHGPGLVGHEALYKYLMHCLNLM
jgi:hypothetical protein